MADSPYTASRRGFLSRLATLPLIGSGIALINRRAAATPVTRQMLLEYSDWLGWERSRICEELHGSDGREQERVLSMASNAYDWHRGLRPKAPGENFFNSPPASSRAALILSTAGVDWRK